MNITDTHCHLYLDAFKEDIDAVISRAMELGISRFFLPAIDSEHTGAMLELQAAYPGQVFLMAGLHPTHVKENFREELKHVEQLLLSGAY